MHKFQAGFEQLGLGGLLFAGRLASCSSVCLCKEELGLAQNLRATGRYSLAPVLGATYGS